MTSHRKTLLFVGHDASRGGAQLSLLRILKWMRSNYDARLLALLKAGGELLPEYQQLAGTVLLNPVRPSSRFFQRLRRRFVLEALGRRRIDLVYVNTVAALDVVPRLRARYRGPLLSHVRELEMLLNVVCGSEFFSRMRRYVDAYVVGTDAAETMLMTKYQISRELIHRVPQGIVLPLAESGPAVEAITDLRRELGVAPDAFIVGGCGNISWWKSPEVFIQVARHVVSRRLRPPVHFVWIGGGFQTDIDQLLYDREKLGLTQHVHFLGARVDPVRYFSAFNVFLLTSREDIHPSVCFETGFLGIPTVCFEGSGGAADFVGEDAGFVVPYLDTQAAAERIIALLESPELRMAMGRRASEKVRTEHNFDETGRQLLAVLRKFIEGQATGRVGRGVPA